MRLLDHCPPELVVFDVDGTLHDTFGWWVPVIRRGVAALAAREGLDLELPSDGVAQAVVGMKNEGGWGPLLPAVHRHRWQELREITVPLEVAELTSGRDYLFPGVRELPAHLRDLNVKIALASNCHSRYMAALKEGQGLGALTDWQFCLSSPGVTGKADMIRSALEVAGARRVIVVGDREPDRDGARALGLPFLWRRNPFCDLGDAQGVWDGDPDELLPMIGLPRIS